MLRGAPAFSEPNIEEMLKHDPLTKFTNTLAFVIVGGMEEQMAERLRSFASFNLGMEIKRISTSIQMKKPMLWGAYMGSEGNGVLGMKK